MENRVSLLAFDIYGYTIRVESTDFDLNELRVSEDFRYFRKSVNSADRLCVRISKVERISQTDRKGFKIGQTEMCEVRQISFSDRQLIYRCDGIDLAIVTDATGTDRVISIKTLNIEILEDILYFLINSCSGEYLDMTGLMRIHGLAYKSPKTTGIVYGRQKTGKSTLALALLAAQDVQIFSDEVAIFDIHNNRLLPYPLRIASVDLPAEHSSLSRFNYFFNKKRLWSAPVEKIAQPSALTQLFAIEENRVGMFVDLILGLGLIQMREYLLRPNGVNVLFKILKNRFLLTARLTAYPFTKISRSSPREVTLKALLNSPNR